MKILRSKLLKRQMLVLVLKLVSYQISKRQTRRMRTCCTKDTNVLDSIGKQNWSEDREFEAVDKGSDIGFDTTMMYWKACQRVMEKKKGG